MQAPNCILEYRPDSAFAWECFLQIDFCAVYDIITIIKAAGKVKSESLFDRSLVLFIRM